MMHTPAESATVIVERSAVDFLSNGHVALSLAVCSDPDQWADLFDWAINRRRLLRAAQSLELLP